VLSKPAALYRPIEAGAILGRAAAVLVQEWSVDVLDEYPAILHGFDGVAISTSLRAAASGSA
jgi:hypothetical protein